jgi:hypothetical protein
MLAWAAAAPDDGELRLLRLLRLLLRLLPPLLLAGCGGVAVGRGVVRLLVGRC